jgi:hypothetical protein
MGVHEDRGNLKKREEEMFNSSSRPALVVSPIERDAVHLNKKKIKV